MEENGSTIVLRYLKDNFIRGAYDPDEGKIIRTQNGYKIRFLMVMKNKRRKFKHNTQIL